ncbi:farnesol dehydrogenase [Contarinia nasturtii]|uniref:farnesol dehydrogenase n=1 Tax=Contarinia nasturtii TaxID=265458 RepID=UPI0012D3C8F2|nr:farnesol dehydrogenase [Contarinia nasturtii]XP_031628690.1 farnesol dehydrogenase [Contarinia nasturtii]
MDRWNEKTAVVTGASSGIGAAIVLDLLKAGVNVVGLARRKERIDALREKIPANSANGKLYAIKCDLTQESDIKSAFNWIESNLGGTDILVNNAGIIKTMNLLDPNNTDNLRESIDTNVLAVVLASREAFQSMKKRHINGHIIHINSCAGHKIPYFVGMYPSFNIYPSTKFAVTAMTEVMRQELQNFGTKIKVTSISPGAVKTEIFKPEILELIQNIPFLDPEDVSQAVMYALATREHVQVHELIIKPIGEHA